MASFESPVKTLIRWFLTRHVLAEFTGEVRIRSGTVAIDESFHEERKPAALKRDESHVNLICTLSISPDPHFSFDVLIKSVNVFNFDLDFGL
jgi:hypothetical protein